MTRLALVIAVASACTIGDAAGPADAPRDGAPTPVACDGGLCDTTNHASCSAGAPSGLVWLALPLALALRRRRR